MYKKIRKNYLQFSKVIIKFLGSKTFFWIIIGLFIFQAVWLAFSFRYPMVYDEQYHFGVTNFFSNQISPWIENQPFSLDQYGALERQASLLYHYLLSFPLRLIQIFFDGLAEQVVLLRLINISFFTAGLIIFARLFKEIGISQIFRNITLLFFALLPVTPFVAAHINYDNAIFLLTALLFLIGVKIINNPSTLWYQYAVLILLGLSGVLIKFSFMPIFVGAMAYIIIRVLFKNIKTVKSQFIHSFKTSSLWLKILIIIPLIIVSFLFGERFGINLLQYRSINPSCQSQIGEDRCFKNYIAQRAYDLEEARKQKIPQHQPQYTMVWGTNIIYTLLISGGNTKGEFAIDAVQVAQPLPIIYMTVFWSTVVSVILFIYNFDRLRKLSAFWFLSLTAGVYTLSLFYTNLKFYNTYYEALAIQGRYFLPFIPIFIMFSLLSINYSMHNLRWLKLPLLFVVFTLYLNGAGLITHIIRSESSWYWQKDIIIQSNARTKEILDPVVKEWWYDRN